MIEWDDIAESIRLEEVLSDLDIEITDVARGEHWASCPLPTHPGADAKPSFSVNEQTLLYNCFVCNEGGPLPLLVASMQDLETDEDGTRWNKALEWLLPFSDADVREDDDDGFMEQLERYLDRNEVRTVHARKVEMPYYSRRIIERLDYAPLDLLSKWQIEHEATVEQFDIRYEPSRYRSKAGKEYYGPALLIPHFYRGDLVGYQERWLDEERPKWIPKYTNSDNFPKADTLFNWDGAKEEARRGLPVLVVESTMTAIRLWEIGYAAVATFGASVRDEQIRLLSTFHAGGVILAFDSDPAFRNTKGEWIEGAGKKAFATVSARLLDLGIPVHTIEVTSDSKDDLADLSEEQIHALITQCAWVYR